jgi:hypothetical protein
VKLRTFHSIVIVFTALALVITYAGVQMVGAQDTVGGNWKGKIRGGPRESVLAMELQQNGEEVTGSHEIAHADGRKTGGPIRGAVKGKQVTLKTSTATFTLALAEDGSTLSGNGISSVNFSVELTRVKAK